MGKRKHRDREEREAREHRRKARSAVSRMRHTVPVDPPEDVVAFNAEGFVGKRAHATGTPEHWPTTVGETILEGLADGLANPDPRLTKIAADIDANSVVPPDENEGHATTTTTG